MPIDWDAVVAPFREVFGRQMKELLHSVILIGRWLKKAVEDAQKLERASRAYPIIDFYNGAVQASVARFQHNTLSLPVATPGPRPPDEYMSAWRRFATGFQRIPDALEEALAIPRFIRVIESMLSTIVDSLERWEKPDWRMFDLNQKRSFSDLFGEVFYFAEMLSLSVDPIRVVINSEVAKLLFQPSGKESKTDLDAQLAEAIRYMVSALLLLPLGMSWIAALFRWGLISVKVSVLDFLTSLEDMVYGLRRKALEFAMGGLVEALREAYFFIAGIKIQFMYVLSKILTFGIGVLMAWTRNVRIFLYDVSHFMIKGVGGLFAHLIGALEGVLDVNVLKIFAAGFDTGTLRDIINKTYEYYALRANIMSVGTVLGGLYDVSIFGYFWPKYLRQKAWAADTVVGILGNLPKTPVPKVNLPAPASPFPNVYDYFTTLKSVDLPGKMQSLRGVLETRLPGMLWDAGDALTKMGDGMSASAGQMANIGPLSVVTRVRDFADSTAAALFGDQEKDLGAALRHDALAAAFDLAVASGGFHIVGGAIPLYVDAMREFWENQPPEPTPALPTSPHILAMRKRLGRVKAPLLTIRSSARALDDILISRVASEFRRAVQGAWSTGLRKLEAGA